MIIDRPASPYAYETPNARQLEKVILEISSIGLPKIVNFTNSFIATYPDAIFQNQIFDIVLRKIEVSSPTKELKNLFHSKIMVVVVCHCGEYLFWRY